MITEIKGAFDSLKMAKDIGQGILQLEIDIRVREKIIDWLLKMNDVQDTLFRLQSEVEDLRKQLKDKEMFEKDLSEYSIEETPGGATVLVHNTLRRFACPSCRNNLKIEILQPLSTFSGIYRCPGCKNEFRVRPSQDPSPNRGPGRGAFL